MEERPLIYAKVELLKEKEALDEIEVSFGIRKYSVDQEKGFILNEVPYHLHGVARHQDRLDMGWAIGEKDHKGDIELIKEVGATTIRLAHYQHDSYFYDLCDKAGMVIWAEIPFISVFINTEEAKENTLSQMKELIVQNYNHPSICFWGIANEISVGGETLELERNLVELNSLCKKLDPNRLTTIANVSMTPIDSKHNYITDIVSYNHYFGWYGGEVGQTATWYDMYHNTHPNTPIAISEYGAEAVLTWHSDEPKCKDYTEEYQALYHEKMLEILEARPFIWASYMWNMFDFAADARKEGEDVIIAGRKEGLSDEEKLTMVKSLSVETIIDFVASKLPQDSKFIVNYALNKIKK